jgi:pimeloyl-ACP methyl ester carboxylesterase
VAAVGLVAENCSSGFLRSFTRPKLFVIGDQDRLAGPQALHDLVDQLPPPKILHTVTNADHFFWGREREVGNLVAEFIASW